MLSNRTTHNFRLDLNLYNATALCRKNYADNTISDHFHKQMDVVSKLMKRLKSENNEATMESATMRGENNERVMQKAEAEE